MLPLDAAQSGFYHKSLPSTWYLPRTHRNSPHPKRSGFYQIADTIPTNFLLDHYAARRRLVFLSCMEP
ncbi:MAG: hypothetical protein ABI613_08050 [Gemmatimonadota bacterium]